MNVRASRRGLGKLVLGRKNAERVKSALSFARISKAVWKKRQDAELDRVFKSYRAGLPLNILTEPARLSQHLAARVPDYRDPLQKPQEFYMPDLPSAPFLEPDEIARVLTANVEMIRAEYAAFCGDETPTPSKRLVNAGNWSTVPLMRKEGQFKANIGAFPKTWALMQRLPLLPSVHGGIYFSVLDPGTHIKPHCGPTNLRIRYHLTIANADNARIRSGTQWRTWEENGCLLLDDSYEHEVRHEGSSRRVVLIVDCWHPGLTRTERMFLDEIYEAWYPGNGWITRMDLAAA